MISSHETSVLPGYSPQHLQRDKTAISPSFKCERCGKCCVNHATWDELPSVLKCIVMDFYPELESLYRGVNPKTGWCPNLRMDGKVAVCTIYDKRPTMCVVYRCDQAEAMGLWNRREAPAP